MDLQQSPLLALPPELRDQILETLFFDAQLSDLCKSHPRNPFQRANYGILAANKQLRREAIDIVFHGAVLRLDIDLEAESGLPTLYTKTVIPVWSWYIRDRYRDKGTDLGFLKGWQGLRNIRHVEVSQPPHLMTEEALSVNLNAWEMAIRFLDGLPDVGSLTIYTEWHGSISMKDCEKKLRSMTSVKLLVLGTGDCCAHQSLAHIVRREHPPILWYAV